MGNHSSVRASSGRSGWRRVAIAAAVVGFAYATVGVVGLASGTTTPTPSVYSAITPVTVLGKSLAADSNTDVTVAGVDGVPSNATSVQLSVTALDGTTTSSMYVYPTGATKPTSANVRWQTGQTITIPVTVAVGTSGDIRLTTDGGTVTIKVALVGYFSPAQAPGSSGYAAGSAGVPITNSATTLASLTLRAGTYEVYTTATMFLTSGTTETVECYLEDPSHATIDGGYTGLSKGVPYAAMSMVGLDTTSGGAFTTLCDDESADAAAYDVRLVAVQLSSATGLVTGG